MMRIINKNRGFQFRILWNTRKSNVWQISVKNLGNMTTREIFNFDRNIENISCCVFSVQVSGLPPPNVYPIMMFVKNGCPGFFILQIAWKNRSAIVVPSNTNIFWPPVFKTLKLPSQKVGCKREKKFASCITTMRGPCPQPEIECNRIPSNVSPNGTGRGRWSRDHGFLMSVLG